MAGDDGRGGRYARSVTTGALMPTGLPARQSTSALGSRPVRFWLKLAVVVLVAVGTAAVLLKRVDPVVAHRVLAENGYVDIVLAQHLDFYSFFAGCDRRYHLFTPFEATMAETRVRGVVCSGNTAGRGPEVRRYN